MRLLLLLFFSASVFTSCSTSPSGLEEWIQSNEKIKVLCTTAMIHDIVKQIGGNRVDSIALMVGDIDPHSYELVKGDDEKLCFAQVIFYNGLGLEHGASLHYALTHHPHAFSLGDSVQKAAPSLILHTDKSVDPHIWMDISLWTYIIDPIVDALTLMDRDGGDLYNKNGQQLKQKMLQEHTTIKNALQAVPEEKRYLVTSHDAFNYFARAYLATEKEIQKSQWEKRFDAPEGLAPEGQLSVSDIQKIVDHLIRYEIQIVFPESNISADSLKKIINACSQKGLKVYISSEVLYGDAMGPKKIGTEGYLSMIRYDANVMIKEWQKER